MLIFSFFLLPNYQNYDIFNPLDWLFFNYSFPVLTVVTVVFFIFLNFYFFIFNVKSLFCPLYFSNFFLLCFSFSVESFVAAFVFGVFLNFSFFVFSAASFFAAFVYVIVLNFSFPLIFVFPTYIII